MLCVVGGWIKLLKDLINFFRGILYINIINIISIINISNIINNAVCGWWLDKIAERCDQFLHSREVYYI